VQDEQLLESVRTFIKDNHMSIKRCAELKAQGKVKDSGERRRTRSGRFAAVLRAVEETAS
jgi:hypothetical protein